MACSGTPCAINLRLNSSTVFARDSCSSRSTRSIIFISSHFHHVATRGNQTARAKFYQVTGGTGLVAGVMMIRMRTPFRFSAFLLFSAGSTLGVATGCAGPPTGSNCTSTSFTSPTSATLDHTIAGNSATFTTGTHYSGNCAIPAVLVQYQWQVSDPIDASITPTGGVASCINASLAPVTVSTYIANINSSGATVLVASGQPSATLTCK